MFIVEVGSEPTPDDVDVIQGEFGLFHPPMIQGVTTVCT